MSPKSAPNLPKWPFLAGDLTLLGVAWWLMTRHPFPWTAWPLLLTAVCVAGGAWLCVLPFLTEHRTSAKLAESDGLHVVVEKIEGLKRVEKAIGEATDRWNEIHERARQASEAAESIADRMSAEAKGFAEFIQKANDTERAHLRLEVDKLRRTESEWVQTLVMLLDHVYALHQAGVRSGKASLVTQLGQFQHACRDAARRVGLVPFEAASGASFQEEEHEASEPDSEATVLAGRRVVETVATGYTYQGKRLRKPLVKVEAAGEGAPSPGELFQLTADRASSANSGSVLPSEQSGAERPA